MGPKFVVLAIMICDFRRLIAIVVELENRSRVGTRRRLGSMGIEFAARLLSRSTVRCTKHCALEPFLLTQIISCASYGYTVLSTNDGTDIYNNDVNNNSANNNNTKSDNIVDDNNDGSSDV